MSYRCNVRRHFLPGCFHRNILVFAKVNSSVASTKQLHFQTFIARQRNSPIIVVAAIITIVVPSTASTTTGVVVPSFTATWAFRFLPAIVSR